MNDKKILGTFVAATLLTLGVCIAYLGMTDTSDDNIRLVLRAGGKFSFVLLLVVFIARPLRQLIRAPFTQSLLKNRALIGVSFAGAHTAHLMMIIYRTQQNPEFELTPGGTWTGIVLYTLIYAMLITTFSRPRRTIGPRYWRILHKTGLYVLTLGFIQSQLPSSLDDLSAMNWWLMPLIVVALVIRLTAFFARRSRK